MNLIDLGIKSVIVGTLGWMAVSALRRSSASTRHTLLFLAIGGVCLLPIVSALLPSWHMPFYTISEHTVSTPTVAPNSVAVTTTMQAAPKAPSTGFSVTEILAALWTAGAALLGIRLGIRLYRLAKTEREFEMNSDPRLQELVSNQCRLSRRHVLLLQGPAGEPPMTWGQSRPVLVLPEDAYGWPDDRLTSVVMHELAHIERSDWLISLFAEATCAINWFNPFVWVMKRQMEIESETAADDRVLSQGVSAVQYASHLVDVTRQLCLERSSTHVALAMARPGKLDTRIRAILEGKRSRRNLRGSITLVLAATISGIAALVATAAPTVVRHSSGGAVPKLTSDLLHRGPQKVLENSGDIQPIEFESDKMLENSADDAESFVGDIPPVGQVEHNRAPSAKRASHSYKKVVPAPTPKVPAPAAKDRTSITISGDDPEIHVDLSEIAEELKKAGAEVEHSKAESMREISAANREAMEGLAKAHFPNKKFAETIARITKASAQMALNSVQGLSKTQLDAAAKSLKSLSHPSPPTFETLAPLS